MTDHRPPSAAGLSEKDSCGNNSSAGFIPGKPGILFPLNQIFQAQKEKCPGAKRSSI